MKTAYAIFKGERDALNGDGVRELLAITLDPEIAVEETKKQAERFAEETRASDDNARTELLEFLAGSPSIIVRVTSWSTEIELYHVEFNIKETPLIGSS